jgi:hypothetical protein
MRRVRKTEEDKGEGSDSDSDNEDDRKHTAPLQSKSQVGILPRASIFAQQRDANRKSFNNPDAARASGFIENQNN